MNRARRTISLDALDAGRRAAGRRRRATARARRARRHPRSSRGRICPSASRSDYLRAEAREGLRELAADRAAADHGEPAGQLGQGEDRLVREIAGLGQPGDGRLGRAGARRDHRLLEAERHARDVHGVRSGEARRAEEHVHAEVAKARRRVHPADPRAQPAHPIHHRAEVHARAGRHPHAELARPAHVGDGAGRPDQALRRHAADVEAIAAHQPALDERHARAEPGRARRRDQPRGARPDHDQVVAARGLGIRPVFRVDIGHERLVVGVPWLDGDLARVLAGIAHVRGTRSASARRARRVTKTVTAIVATRPTA